MLIAFNKPYGVVSQFTPAGADKTPTPAPGRRPVGLLNRTLAEFGFPKNVYPIGRLDADSEGLLLLSDEPAWNERLLHPRHAHEREYRAQVEKIPTPEALKKLERGVSIQGRKTLPCRAWILEPQPEVGVSRRDARDGRLGEPSLPQIPPRIPPIRVRKNVPDCWIGLELIEGKNRQVRRMTAAIGHPTLRLIRMRIGNFWLGDLPLGQWRILTAEEYALVVKSGTGLRPVC
ncbi:MAG: pseudouridine synthase [Verrucomicrobiota bacterium]|jgi:23S rRNA pseudouridine2457 synthase